MDAVVLGPLQAIKMIMAMAENNRSRIIQIKLGI